MTRSNAQKERELQPYVGDLGKPKVDPHLAHGTTYRVVCRSSLCVKPHGQWSTFRQDDNSYGAALDRWALHLHYVHPGTEAPCMERLDAARQRVKERKAAEEAEVRAVLGDLT